MIWHYFHPTFDYEADFDFVDKQSGWVGHKFFVYDLIRNLQPKKIVELGTHYGTSFFAMCQAVKDKKYLASLFAVDTWKGDKHAGFYDETPIRTVKKVIREKYAKQKTKLLRMTFDEAVKKFSDNSIDLLHIDGLHTYRAVKHDFDTWLPKVKPNGIILFHDVYEKKDDFGVYKLWEKLKKKCAYLDFWHAHGLGILFLDPTTKKQLEIDLNTTWQNYYSRQFESKPALIENTKLKEKTVSLSKKNRQLKADLLKIQSAKTYKVWQAFNLLKHKLLG
jgi:hypothetical protein